MTLKKQILNDKQNIISDVQQLVRIPSVSNAAEPGMPFGYDMHNALKYVLDLAAKMSFKVRMLDGQFPVVYAEKGLSMNEYRGVFEQGDEERIVYIKSGKSENTVPGYCEAYIKTERKDEIVNAISVFSRENRHNMPSSYTIIIAIMAIVAIMSHILPGGAYDYVDPTASKLEPEFKELAAKYDAIYKEEYKISDADVKVSFESVDADIDKVFTKESKEHVIDVGVFCENGILRMSMELEGVVESSNNLGIVVTEEDKVLFSFCTRSFLESVYSTMVTNIDRLARSTGGRSYKEYDCLEWPYQSESHLRDLFVTNYEKLFDRPAKAIALHTGLECGMIGKNMGRKVDMISLGPECKDLHKPGEWLSISSTERYWKLFIEVLKNL